MRRWSLPRKGDERPNLKRNGCSKQGGDFRVIVGGRHLDHIAADKLESFERAHHFQRFEACEPSNYRRARSRSKRRIDAVYVKREITSVRARNLAERLEKNPTLAEVMEPFHVENADPSPLREVVVTRTLDVATYANLENTVSLDQALLNRSPDRCTVVELLSR